MNQQTLLNAGLLLLRVVFGLGIAYHGYGKVFGGFMDQFAVGVGKLGFPFPIVFAWAAALSEFAGGIALILGLATRPAALFLFITMFVAAFMQHAADTLQVKEMALAYGTAFGALLLTGAGSWSVDGAIRGQAKPKS